MKKLILLSLVMLMAVFAFADNYTIGNGTSTQPYIPFYGLYDYGWTKIVYTPTELSTAGLTASSGITAIGFYVGNTPVNYVAVDQRVYLRQTAATFYDTADNTLPDNTLFTNVYQGDLTFNGGGWHYVTFTAPFVWDGTSSIEIVWENWDGNYASGPSFRYTTTSPDYRAVYKYTDDTFPATATGTRYYYRPNIQFVTPSTTPPNAVTLSTPLDLEVNQSLTPTLSWTPAASGALADSYKVYLDTNTNPSTLVASPTTGSATLTEPLIYNTTYYWKVIAHNVNGDSPASNVFSFTTKLDPTVSSFPWTVDFGTSAADWPVSNWTQLYGFISGTPTANGTQWAQDEWLNVNGTNKAAKINIWGSTRYGWLLSPPINVPAEAYELKFDAALMAWNASTPATGTLADDRFIVVMSDSPLMTNPTILREWNNSGSPDVLNSIPNTGQNYSIPLTGISGIKYFAFYAESSISGNGDNDLMIDNVVIQLASVTPAFGVTPAEKLFGTVAVNSTVQQTFTISNTGGGELQLSSVSLNGDPQFTLVDSNSYPATLTNLPLTVTVVFHPIAEGNFSTTLTIVDNLSKASHNVTITGSGTDAVNLGGGDATTTAGGYFFANNVSIAAPVTPAYSWVNETSNSVSETTDQDDKAWGPFPLGFVFNYYGVNYSEVWVSSNGFISFGSGSNSWSNNVLPYYSTPNNLIALFWDDLKYFAGSSNLYYGGNGSTFTITFDHFGITGLAYDPLLSVTAQVILYADGRIKLQYNDITGSLTTNYTASVGIENADGSKGIQYNKDGIGGPLSTGTKAGGIAIMFGSSLLTLPVELSSFTAVTTAENFVNLTWISESETNLLGYRVYRNDSDNYSQSTLLTPVMLQATNSSTQHKYDFTDREVETEQVYYYWLESVDYNSTTVHGPVQVTVLGNESPNIPAVTMMRAAYPNPFKGSTSIALDVKAGETATVTIYNLAGQAVRSYQASQGSHTINWDGRDAKNQNCASGVYFYRLTSPSRNITKKMVMVK